MSTVDLSRYSFSGGEHAAVDDLTSLPQMDHQRLVLAGIDVHDKAVSGAFMQMDHAGVHCQTRQEGLELMDIRKALEKYDGLPQHCWKLLTPDKDDFTRMAHEQLNGGYFVRVAKGVRLSEPVQSCMFIKGHGAGQSIHNIVIVEEGAELHILGGCATAHDAGHAAHLGITEYYVEKGGKLTFTMIHNWGESTVVRPRSAGVVDAGGVFQNNYILLKPVGDLQMNPLISLNGEGAVARFNSVVVAPVGSYVDSGNRIELNAPHTRGEVISRVLTTGGTVINRGLIRAAASPARGHLECKGLIMGGGRIHAIPELDSNQDGVELSHEAAVGKIAQEEMEYLMARGLDEDEAASTIVRGFLNVDIMGLPAPLQKAMDEQIALLDAGKAM
ncbi:MAG: SufD family Fe-S cluster assembly protein [Desulfovibrio sp.]|nr:SufD family Fe-S cluster assembly protein [Desulfovibrio sp.]